MNDRRFSRIRRIRLISRMMKALAYFAVAAFAVLYLVAFTSPEGVAAVVHTVAGRGFPATLGNADLAVVFLIGAVPFTLFLAAVFTAGRLFGAFQKGCILDPIAGALLCRIGTLVLLSEVAGVLAQAAATAYMSMQSGTGSGTVTISTTNLAGILLGVVILVAGWAIGEAAEVAEDNRQFV
ncbi:MAG: hypothetical protein AAGB11_07215 [Pseudomonadota bacterium]